MFVDALFKTSPNCQQPVTQNGVIDKETVVKTCNGQDAAEKGNPLIYVYVYMYIHTYTYMSVF